MRQMGGQDASFIYNEAPRMPMHIAGLAIYDPSTAKGGTVTFKGILDHIRSRMALVPSYRERMVRVPFDLDHPWWLVDPDFDLEFHVRHIALPQPGDWRQLCIQAARLHAASSTSTARSGRCTSSRASTTWRACLPVRSPS